MKVVLSALTLVGLGTMLVAYAHSQFVSKDSMQYIRDKIDIIDKRVYDLHEKVFQRNR